MVSLDPFVTLPFALAKGLGACCSLFAPKVNEKPPPLGTLKEDCCEVFVGGNELETVFWPKAKPEEDAPKEGCCCDWPKPALAKGLGALTGVVDVPVGVVDRFSRLFGCASLHANQ